MNNSYHMNLALGEQHRAQLRQDVERYRLSRAAEAGPRRSPNTGTRRGQGWLRRSIGLAMSKSRPRTTRKRQ
jgi:hypothetical protein